MIALLRAVNFIARPLNSTVSDVAQSVRAMAHFDGDVAQMITVLARTARGMAHFDRDRAQIVRVAAQSERDVITRENGFGLGLLGGAESSLPGAW